MILALLLTPWSAVAADWIYHVRPTDNIWDLSRRYLKPDVSWQKLQQYNKVTDPLHLPPGMTLHIPVAWLRVQPAKARVVAVIGHARARRSGETGEVDVGAGMQFGYGARLTTDADANLTLEFADGSRVLLHGGSELDLDRMTAYGRTGMADTRLRLQHGRMTNDVTHMNGTAAHFNVTTPNAISSVRGTHFRVATTAEHAQTEVLRGHVDVAGHKHHVMVGTGMGVGVAAGARPGQVQRLLKPPQLQCPARPISQVPYALRWTALPGAKQYRVQVASDTRFEALLLDHVVDTNGAGLPDLPDGSYAVRIHGIDARQLEGEDAGCNITVSAHPQPPLVMEPQPGSKVRDQRPNFRWTESDQAASYAWQLAGDASFEHPLASRSTVTGDHVRAPDMLPYGHYYWRIASRDHDGKQGPYSQVLPFDLEPPPAAPELGSPTSSGQQMSFSWQPGLPGQHYRVQMARHDDFAHPLVDKTTDKPGLQIKKPGSGRWYLRVQTIDADGYAGPWSPVQRIKLPCMPCRIAAAGGGAAALLWLLL